MRRFLITIIILFIVLICCSCSNTKNEKTIKIGVIDSCISYEIQDKYNITEMNNIIRVETENNVTHGSMILSIILQNVSNCEVFYCSVLNENCVGEIETVAKAIEWCINNNVDIITMSFATLTDNKELRKSIEKAIDNNIIVIASCINLSDAICYPAMYDGVISVSEGFNNQATIILKNKKVKFNIDGIEIEKRQVSFLTAYVCSEITNQLSQGKIIEEIIKKHDFD